MSIARMVLVLLAALQLGCGASKPPVAGPVGVTTIAVDPTTNSTEKSLVLEDPGLLGRVLDVQRSAVPELLRSDLRAALTARGFDVVERGGNVPVLRTEVRKWEPYAADYSMVVVDVVASVVEQPSGREVWRTDRTAWRVSTPDARSSYDASVMAANSIAETLVRDWRPHD
jgi:hypothetical protein